MGSVCSSLGRICHNLRIAKHSEVRTHRPAPSTPVSRRKSLQMLGSSNLGAGPKRGVKVQPGDALCVINS